MEKEVGKEWDVGKRRRRVGWKGRDKEWEKVKKGMKLGIGEEWQGQGEGTEGREGRGKRAGLRKGEKVEREKNVEKGMR